MKPNEPSMTLRQRYEVKKTATTKPAVATPAAAKPQSYFPSYLRDDSFLGELVGHPITVTFMNGDETSGILNSFYRFAIKLDDGQIIFKHSIQTVRPATEAGSASSQQDLDESTQNVLH